MKSTTDLNTHKTYFHLLIVTKKHTLISAATGGKRIAKIDRSILPAKSPMINIYQQE
jgi:hypothetical protein